MFSVEINTHRLGSAYFSPSIFTFPAIITPAGQVDLPNIGIPPCTYHQIHKAGPVNPVCPDFRPTYSEQYNVRVRAATGERAVWNGRFYYDLFATVHWRSGAERRIGIFSKRGLQSCPRGTHQESPRGCGRHVLQFASVLVSTAR
jgi:hypothetical protein